MSNNQKKGLKRNAIDKYYTSQNAVKLCMQKILQYVNIGRNDICIEPSAGNGAFINGIKAVFSNYSFYDLLPEYSQYNQHNDICEQDYLQYDYTQLVKKGYNKIHVVGNPPFGRQSSMAIKFIKLSCQYCDTLCFILPKSFKKDSMKKHFPLNFHLLYECDMPNNSFVVNNKKYNVPCIFQIWEKRQENRAIPKKIEPIGYRFVKKTDTINKPDISFRRIGLYAGKIYKEIENKSIQTHYFIKFNKKINNTQFRLLNNIKYDCSNNTTGPKSISKQELIKEFNVLIKEFVNNIF